MLTHAVNAELDPTYMYIVHCRYTLDGSLYQCAGWVTRRNTYTLDEEEEFSLLQDISTIIIIYTQKQHNI